MEQVGEKETRKILGEKTQKHQEKKETWKMHEIGSTQKEGERQ